MQLIANRQWDLPICENFTFIQSNIYTLGFISFEQSKPKSSREKEEECVFQLIKAISFKFSKNNDRAFSFDTPHHHILWKNFTPAFYCIRKREWNTFQSSTISLRLCPEVQSMSAEFLLKLEKASNRWTLEKRSASSVVKDLVIKSHSKPGWRFFYILLAFKFLSP